MHSAMSNYKHGMRSENLCLPNEDPAFADELIKDWTGHYAPETPGRKALVDRAVLSCVLHERGKLFLNATVGNQVRGAVFEFDRQQIDETLGYIKLLREDPAAAVRGLKRSARGCRWLIQEFMNLKAELDRAGSWATSSREHASRIMGHKPDDVTDPYAYLVRRMNLLLKERPNQVAMAEISDRARVPDVMHYMLKLAPPGREQCLRTLHELMEIDLENIRTIEAYLRTEIEQPARASAQDKAVMLAGEDLTRFIKYQRMHEAILHTAYNSLERGEKPGHDGNPRRR